MSLPVIVAALLRMKGNIAPRLAGKPQQGMPLSASGGSAPARPSAVRT